MKIDTFELERYFAKYEFSAQYMLSSSDCETISMSELIDMADQELIGLWRNLKLGYTETEGHPMLRESIAELYDDFYADQMRIVVPQEGIFLL